MFCSFCSINFQIPPPPRLMLLRSVPCLQAKRVQSAATTPLWRKTAAEWGGGGLRPHCGGKTAVFHKICFIFYILQISCFIFYIWHKICLSFTILDVLLGDRAGLSRKVSGRDQLPGRHFGVRPLRVRYFGSRCFILLISLPHSLLSLSCIIVILYYHCFVLSLSVFILSHCHFLIWSPCFLLNPLVFN